MDPTARTKLLENIQNDLKNISLETKKSKHLQPVRESTDEAIVKIRSLASQAHSSGADINIFQASNHILYPLVQGCETKDAKVVKLCLSLMQRLIVHKVLDFRGAKDVTDTLWMLMEAGIEEVKILQTLTLLLTSSHVVQNETLAKCLVICLRLNFTKDPTTNTIAGATVRQLVPAVLERVEVADQPKSLQHCYEEPGKTVKELTKSVFPPGTNPLITDAYLLIQDIVLLVGADQPKWLVGIVEMTRTFGLELLETLLTKFPQVFHQHQQYKLLLKERVCSLVIKLFSPNLKYKMGGSGNQQHQDMKPSYAITSKLLRVVAVLILQYHDVLTTETEIFLSLIMKFMDPDKPSWQNGSALEVIHKIMVQPDLLTFICSQFDMNGHSTNVFQDIINSLGAFVQNVMLASNPNDALGDNASSSGSGSQSSGQSSLAVNTPYGPGMSPQPGFSCRNVWKPLTINFIGGQTKEIYLDVSDRGEVPQISDGYCISLAYVILLDVVRSLAIVFDKNEESKKECHQPLLESSWCGLLSALSLLLDSSTDDSSTENILKQLETFASFCGKTKLERPRDAFLASICKASLPPHYTLNVLKATPSTQNVSGPKSPGDPSNVAGLADHDIRHQVVAVGTPLPTASLPTSAHQGPVMLTAKNLQCMRAILSVAHCHGNLLGSSWHIILTTLQHLVWILGLKPMTSGLTTSGSSSTENSSVITTAVMADLPVLSNMVTRLFESSTELSDISVKYLIEALSRLSDESIELASSNREPSLFAVAKLLETALGDFEFSKIAHLILSRILEVNLGRVDVVWRPITSHLLVVCQHPHLRMRQWGCEAITHLTRQALQFKHEPALKDNNRLQTLLLSPLAELSAIPYPDIRQKQLDTVLHILHSSGEVLENGWPLILNMIGSLEQDHSDILVRASFQCLQLVFTDFLPAMPYRCYPICVETAAKFGSQQAELNVSLAAIGLLWNLSDYFFQNVKELQKQEKDHQMFPERILSFPGIKNISSFDKLWMCLYCKLKDLCLDSRPSVRKSSGQTLFSTIAAHGSILESNTWQAVLWQVLFPLLDNVIIQSDNASSERVSQSQVILIHHSRNTAQKQWAETKVLTISGVVRVFNTKRNLLRSMGDYSKAWVLLLEYVEKMALSDTTEVSLAALKALQEMITASSTSTPQKEVSDLKEINWTLCWKAWLNIGNQKANYIANTTEVISHAQVLLTGYVQIFHALFPHLKACFRREDVENLGKVLLSCVQVPLDTEFENPNSVTPLHSAALEALEAVKEVALDNSNLIPEVFDVMFKFSRSALTLSKSGSVKDGRFREKFSLFGEACLEFISTFYAKSCELEIVLAENVLFKLIRILHIPLRQKYKCYVPSNWRLAVKMMNNVLKAGIPIARSQPGPMFQDFWDELAIVFENFLFPESIEDQKQEDKVADEAIDCQLIQLLREEVLPFPSQVPTDFIRKIVVLLNKGSIHSSMTLSDDCSGSIGLREEFAKQCFETLLEFSLLDTDISSSGDQGTSVTNRLAITSLLQRFKEVLQEAIDSEKLNKNIPLQRQKVAEISFVLKAIATVIASMKKASHKTVSKKTWNQIIGLYPYLVQFTETTSPQISKAVKDALMEYHELLQPLSTTDS